MAFYYAWQHGHGSMTKLPKEEELLQLPGRGELDFQPMLAELKQGNYQGWTEIFMHPFPRGVPILETVTQVTDEINHSRLHLEKLMSGV
jgi:sugar phosphate isomerase/epimerase